MTVADTDLAIGSVLIQSIPSRGEEEVIHRNKGLAN
jgi:hypothetical protein